MMEINKNKLILTIENYKETLRNIVFGEVSCITKDKTLRELYLESEISETILGILKDPNEEELAEAFMKDFELHSKSRLRSLINNEEFINLDFYTQTYYILLSHIVEKENKSDISPEMNYDGMKRLLKIYLYPTVW